MNKKSNIFKKYLKFFGEISQILNMIIKALRGVYSTNVD